MEFYSDVNNLKNGLEEKNTPQQFFYLSIIKTFLKGIFNNKNPIDFTVFDEAHRTATNSKVTHILVTLSMIRIFL